MDMDDNSLGEYGAKVPKKVLAYTLQDLEPGTAYKVQVTSVAVVDGKEWSSSPATRFIKTVPVPIKEYPLNGKHCVFGFVLRFQYPYSA